MSTRSMATPPTSELAAAPTSGPYYVGDPGVIGWPVMRYGGQIICDCATETVSARVAEMLNQYEADKAVLVGSLRELYGELCSEGNGQTGPGLRAKAALKQAGGAR